MKKKNYFLRHTINCTPIDSQIVFQLPLLLYKPSLPSISTLFFPSPTFPYFFCSLYPLANSNSILLLLPFFHNLYKTHTTSYVPPTFTLNNCVNQTLLWRTFWEGNIIIQINNRRRDPIQNSINPILSIITCFSQSLDHLSRLAPWSNAFTLLLLIFDTLVQLRARIAFLCEPNF